MSPPCRPRLHRAPWRAGSTDRSAAQPRPTRRAVVDGPGRAADVEVHNPPGSGSPVLHRRVWIARPGGGEPRTGRAPEASMRKREPEPRGAGLNHRHAPTRLHGRPMRGRRDHRSRSGQPRVPGTGASSSRSAHRPRSPTGRRSTGQARPRPARGCGGRSGGAWGEYRLELRLEPSPKSGRLG